MVNIQFTIIKTESAEDYGVAKIKDNFFVFFNEKGYLIASEMGDMGSQIECPKCNDGECHNISSIAVGSGKIFGLIACNLCDTLIICKFTRESEKIIKETLKIQEDLINNKWEEMESTKVH